jgi:hypothetical protein
VEPGKDTKQNHEAPAQRLRNGQLVWAADCDFHQQKVPVVMLQDAPSTGVLARWPHPQHVHVGWVVLVHGLFDEAWDGALQLVHCLRLAQQPLEVLMRSGLHVKQHVKFA